MTIQKGDVVTFNNTLSTVQNVHHTLTNGEQIITIYNKYDGILEISTKEVQTAEQF